MALTDNLISYWKLDEASGDAVDIHSTNTLTDTGSVGTTGSGIINSARTFNGSSQYFTHASNAALTTGDIDFTVQAWVNTSSVTVIVPVSKANAGLEEWIIYQISTSFNHEPHFIVRSTGGANATDVAWGAAVSTSAWHLIHAWHDATTNNEACIAVDNGTPVCNSYTFGVGSSSAPFQIGAMDGSQFYDGSIDEVGFWKRVLTAPERTQLYNGGAGLAYSSFGGGGGTLMGQILT